MVISAARLEALKDVPGTSQGRVELSIARRDSADAEELVKACTTRAGPGTDPAAAGRRGPGSEAYSLPRTRSTT